SSGSIQVQGARPAVTPWRTTCASLTARPSPPSVRAGMRRLWSIVLAAMLCAHNVRAEPSPHAVADTSGVGQDTPAFLEASRAEAMALLLGRHMSAKRWDVVLDETLYRLAPRGAWGPDHPAWNPARDALAIALRKASAERVQGE